MERFVGTKQVNATLITLGQYNKIRGWDIPENEDPETEGYLVEYVKGGEPNHPDYAGYISWSPKDVFEESYRHLGTRVYPADIDEMFNSLEYKYERVGETTVTGCWAFLPDGFQVGYGESACVDPANYKPEVGQQIAKDNCEVVARNKLWELEGYLLRHFRSVG